LLEFWPGSDSTPLAMVPTPRVKLIWEELSFFSSYFLERKESEGQWESESERERERERGIQQLSTDRILK
jgi:hypothetical protein